MVQELRSNYLALKRKLIGDITLFTQACTRKKLKKKFHLHNATCLINEIYIRMGSATHLIFGWRVSTKLRCASCRGSSSFCMHKMKRHEWCMDLQKKTWEYMAHWGDPGGSWCTLCKIWFVSHLSGIEYHWASAGGLLGHLRARAGIYASDNHNTTRAIALLETTAVAYCPPSGASS